MLRFFIMQPNEIHYKVCIMIITDYHRLSSLLMNRGLFAVGLFEDLYKGVNYVLYLNVKYPIKHVLDTVFTYTP